MTPFVNLGNEEEMMMVFTKEMMKAMKDKGKAESQKLTREKTKKKMSKKKKLVEMAMARLREMEMEEKEYSVNEVGMSEVMRLVALEPQIIGPVVEVRNGPQLDGLNIMGMEKQRMARSLNL